MHIYKLTKTVSDSRFSIVACTVELFDLKYSREMCMAVLMNCRKTLPHYVATFFSRIRSPLSFPTVAHYSFSKNSSQKNHPYISIILFFGACALRSVVYYVEYFVLCMIQYCNETLLIGHWRVYSTVTQYLILFATFYILETWRWIFLVWTCYILLLSSR